jgi:hypothetical protein
LPADLILALSRNVWLAFGYGKDATACQASVDRVVAQGSVAMPMAAIKSFAA